MLVDILLLFLISQLWIFQGSFSLIVSFNELIKKFPEHKPFGFHNFGQRNVVVRYKELGKRVLTRDAKQIMDRPDMDTEGAINQADKILA